MATPSNNDNVFNKVAETIPLPDLARVSEMNGTMLNEIAKFNAQVSTNMQTVGREWSDFIGMRLREDAQLFRSIHDCRSLQDVQQVCVQFWQTAFTQYGEETQRMLKLTQGTIDDVTRNAQEIRDTVIHTDKAA